ncbi:MAG: iron-sulfur cluster assembly scaffold protein [Promethearchaeota archaeon]|nr:MAG: iron-sulfur cluster assembly scaffold protein [Candidatus Lokiarchaeota archaeon]
MRKIKQKKVEKELSEYNKYIIELFHNPKNLGKPKKADISVSQSYTGPCGDTMQFFLKINDNIIEKANFIADGCAASVTTASQTTILIEGKSLDFAEKLKAEDIDEALKGLPEDHKHCAELSIKTLKWAIKKYKDKRLLDIYE